jgi:hypothetical protein
MIWAYVVALLVAISGVFLIRRIPYEYQVKAARSETARFAADEFYVRANKLLADDRTPQSVLEFVEGLSNVLGKPRLALRVLYWHLLGKLRHDVAQPSQRMRSFHKQINELPEDLRNTFLETMVYALGASAMRAGYLGDLLLNITLFDLRNPKDSRRTGATVAAELASSADYSCMQLG